MINKLLKGFAPAALAALSLGLAGCDINISAGDSDGVPLSELDMSGDPPTELVLAGPDKIIITDGDALAIDVEGDDEAGVPCDDEARQHWLKPNCRSYGPIGMRPI